ncbi:MAG TPA: efflux RND transporter periplasmic adaptor subunit [Terriglobia bacterium]|nr:efflux RND transporter periplasmic adaptor subunit [Terriglobia bacterium]
MDIPRKSAARKKRIRLIIYVAFGLIAVASITWGISRLKPAAPSVDSGTVWRDTVKRGPMDLQVRGLGTLVPEENSQQAVPAVVQGRVVRRLVLPGTIVKADTVIMDLSNPEAEQAALDAEWQVKEAEAQYNSLKAQLDSQLLDQKATAATVKSDYLQAKLKAEKDVQMAKAGIGPEITAQLSQANAEALTTRNQIEGDRVAVLSNSIAAQLAAQKAKVEQLRALYDLKRQQLDSLKVHAGISGVLQELPVEVGQQVAPGTMLAKVADPTKLQAELKIAETQAKDLQPFQKAEIDTHNGVIPGHVIRIDPAVLNGTRTVDVKLDGPLPPGAVPELSVDGTIEIEHLDNVLYVGRPAFGQPQSTVSLFKVVNGGKDAVRVQVKLGRTSVNTVEILQGLSVGDEVVLSDMSRWDSFDRIRLN